MPLCGDIINRKVCTAFGAHWMIESGHKEVYTDTIEGISATPENPLTAGASRGRSLCETRAAHGGANIPAC